MDNIKIIFAIVMLFLVVGFNFAFASQIDIVYPWSEEKTPEGLVGRFYQIALGLGGAAALGVLIYGAILWTLSGAVTSKQDALEWIKGALWGLVLLLGAFLILQTIGIIDKEGKISGIKMPETKMPETKRPDGGISHEAVLSYVDDQRIRNYLIERSGKQISFNKGPCQTPNDTNCTSVANLPQNAVDGLLRIAKECNCAITVTGGTEAGHKTHGPNKPIVDLRYKRSGDTNPNVTLRDYLERQTGVELREHMTKATTKDGKMTVLFEKNKDGSEHYHIVFH